MSNAWKLAELELYYTELSYVESQLWFLNLILKRSTKMSEKFDEIKALFDSALSSIDAEKVEVLAELKKLQDKIDGTVVVGSVITEAEVAEIKSMVTNIIDRVTNIVTPDGASVPPVAPDLTNPRTDANGNKYDASGNIVAADGSVLFPVGSFTLDGSGNAVNSDGSSIFS